MSETSFPEEQDRSGNRRKDKNEKEFDSKLVDFPRREEENKSRDDGNTNANWARQQTSNIHFSVPLGIFFPVESGIGICLFLCAGQ
jgi:hypothetical protein